MSDSVADNKVSLLDASVRPERTLSPLMLRILAVNILALGILVGGLLYLGNYQDHIIATELEAMQSQARIVASAVGENAIVIDDTDQSVMSPMLARMMVRRLAETTENRMRLFGTNDNMLADSRALLAADKTGTKVRVEDLAQVGDVPVGVGAKMIAAIFDLFDMIHEHRVYPPYTEEDVQRASQYDITERALHGEKMTQVWSLKKGGIVMGVAVPVERGPHILGAVMVTRGDETIDHAIYSVRINILQIFFMTLCVTIFLSLYLARAIARPLRQLAQAAEVLRRGQASHAGVTGIANLLRDEAIPDMTNRKDEIGDLSGALRDLTAALARRVGDIENFAADVAHELKNPLTSLRSAIETVERVSDPEARRKLNHIIRDDVDRMTRLITDISSASRLDAELGRAELEPIDVNVRLTQIEDFYRVNDVKDGNEPRVVVLPITETLRVMGVQGRLVQVLQNLIDNALSFSPQDKQVVLSGANVGRFVQIVVDDSGPGLPENKLQAVFDRFYTERPKAEKFGTHSGLGLSISKQIIEAHRGRIWAENRKDASGTIVGARFIVQLPAMGD